MALASVVKMEQLSGNLDPLTVTLASTSPSFIPSVNVDLYVTLVKAF